MLLSLVLFVIWFIQAQYNRYLMPCIGLLAVVAGFGVSHSLQRGVLTKTITFIALLLSVSIAGGLMVQFHMPSIRCGLGLQTRDELLEGFRIYRISREINRTLPEDAKILLLGEDRGFYLEREYMWGPGHHTLLPSDEMKSADDWWRAMRGLGITHCLINFDQVQGPGAKWIGEAVGQGLLRLIHVDGRYGVYALKE
jgi:hypothetical protein